MDPALRSDEDLLAASDGASFEAFYRRHAERMLGYFARRTRDAELAADLTAETFAAALAARRRMGMERIELTDEDIARIERFAELEASTLVEVLVTEQRDAVTAHVIDGRGYADIARELNVSEAVVRKRVSRGLAALRNRIGSRP